MVGSSYTENRGMAALMLQRAAEMERQKTESFRRAVTGGVHSVYDIGIPPINLANVALLSQWGQVGQGLPSYREQFGERSYVRNLQDPQLQALMRRSASASPQVASRIDPERLDAEQVRSLQTLLEREGFPVGRAGADGRFGPDTFAALQRFTAARSLQSGRT